MLVEHYSITTNKKRNIYVYVGDVLHRHCRRTMNYCLLCLIIIEGQEQYGLFQHVSFGSLCDWHQPGNCLKVGQCVRGLQWQQRLLGLVTTTTPLTLSCRRVNRKSDNSYFCKTVIVICLHLFQTIFLCRIYIFLYAFKLIK